MTPAQFNELQRQAEVIERDKKWKESQKNKEIVWERGELVERHNHCAEYIAIGSTDDLKVYTGTWIECDGEFVEILDIEEINQ